MALCRIHLHVPRRCAGFLALLIGLLVAPVAPSMAGVARLVEYVSPLDESIQEYGVYLPSSAAATPAGFPAVFHMHGYGWAVSAGFSDWQCQWADRHGWILINLNARGPQFYEGVGDVETRNVVRDAHQRYGLDLDRLYITGGSMGGTGAFRHGVRYPDIFAAVVGVDGWSDFREWHYHWYARTDMRDQIEEFRRPLLEACSPYYWTGRARWGHVQASVSGRDDVVLPENGINLYNSLLEHATDLPGAYEAQLYLDYAAGHGGSGRIAQAYEYFAAHSRTAAPSSFRLDSTILTHGTLYWGVMDRLTVPGLRGVLESEVSGSVVTVRTANLDAFSLYLAASPAVQCAQVRVYADGFPCYEGPPGDVHLIADRGAAGALWGWRQGDLTGLHKTGVLEGPVGEAFRVPFVVVYGTAGSDAQTHRHREEAEAFARGWNDFMVHATAVRAIREDELAPADLQAKSLVVFGAEDTSTLLREANSRHELPVRVRTDGVTVRDPVYGDRGYLGSHFGAFVCYPNPLTGFATYLVVCRGQWATQPDGSGRQGLEYDLEKLPWAYSDYVVFNTDIGQLPHVLNVNNKPPVTCYEAGYFVEAGYFDQDWQLDRSLTLDRVTAAGLDTRRIHVADVRYAPESEAPAVVVQVRDAAGLPVAQARVTVRTGDAAPLVRGAPEVRSAVTNADGLARFTVTADERRRAVPAEVVNVDATGAVYDFRADEMTTTLAQGLALTVQASDADEAGVATVRASLLDRIGSRQQTSLRLVVPGGAVSPASVAVMPVATRPADVAFLWDTAGLSPGPYRCRLQVTRAEGETLVRPIVIRVPEWPDGSLRLAEVAAADIVAGQPYQITARLLNLSPDQPASAEVGCALLTARRFLPPKSVTVPARGEATVAWTPGAGEAPVAQGTHQVRVTVAGRRGLTGVAKFIAR